MLCQYLAKMLGQCSAWSHILMILDRIHFVSFYFRPSIAVLRWKFHLQKLRMDQLLWKMNMSWWLIIMQPYPPQMHRILKVWWKTPLILKVWWKTPLLYRKMQYLNKTSYRISSIYKMMNFSLWWHYLIFALSVPLKGALNLWPLRKKHFCLFIQLLESIIFSTFSYTENKFMLILM